MNLFTNFTFACAIAGDANTFRGSLVSQFLLLTTSGFIDSDLPMLVILGYRICYCLFTIFLTLPDATAPACAARNLRSSEAYAFARPAVTVTSPSRSGA